MSFLETPKYHKLHNHFLAGCLEVEIVVVIEVMSEGENAVRMARDDTLSDLNIAGE